MNKYYLTLLSVLVLLLTACASVTKDIQVDAKTDPKTNLSGYETYAWLGAAEFLNDPENEWHPPEIQVAEEIKFLIDRELRNKGITLANAADADLAVAFFVGVNMAAMKLKKDPDTNEEFLENVPEGGLVVALVDTDTGFVVWLGSAVADYKAGKYTEEEVRKRLDYAVSRMFDLY